MKKCPERIITRLGPNLVNYFNVNTQRCKFFVLDQGGACYSSLITMSVWLEKILWLKDGIKGDDSSTQVLEIKSREPKADLLD